MKCTASTRRRLSVAVALLASALLAVGPGPAAAEPTDPDGAGNASLKEKLDAAARAYNDAKGRLDVSRARQADLQQRLATTEQRLKELEVEVGPIAAAAYRGSRLKVSMVLLDGAASGTVLHDAATVSYLTARDDREIRTLVQARKDYADQKAALDGEITLAEQQLAEMDKRKQEAERALGNPRSVTISASGQRASANPAPRNADGSWPGESCSQDDPTTSGCLTPRTLNALQQARAAGFDHFTACYRSGGGGEHPKGRACDFSANASTFQNARATGADKTYGDQLSAWFMANADRLGVLYVIWYKQIWFPGLGWRAYTSGDGTPAGDHYNHVHLSVH
ncbi:coiled-coil domain-containing protein [Planosporangium sp. 12N6]|uniref:coiled-coil domain-containing protein n=1 Tax=Planosporangium spinosum TaxID=3402278 RepID=UPI003CE7C20D